MKSTQQMFNPDVEDYNTLKEMVVERENEIESVLGRLESTPVKGTSRSFVVVGPRGMGKTHLLLLLYYEIKKRKELKKKYVSLKFSEEEYSIDSLAFFFIRILQELEKECGSLEEKNRIKEFSEKVKNLENKELVKQADTFLDNLFQKHQMKMALFADNLNEVLKNISTENTGLKHLRSILQSKDYLLIIGSASTFFKEIKDHDEPFYSFFEIIRLPPLTDSGIEELIRKLAKMEDNLLIIEELDSLRPRIKTIVHFTSGIPRLVRMLYYVIANSEITEVADSLEKLLDELTPYYQARMAKLSPQQQKIIDTMALLNGPSTPTEIAKAGRVERPTVNAQLKKLADTGFVYLIQQKKRKWRRYDITERMFRIWREMRRSKSGNRVKYLADFLKAFYTEDEFQRHIDQIDEKFSLSLQSDASSDAIKSVKEYESLNEKSFFAWFDALEPNKRQFNAIFKDWKFNYYFERENAMNFLKESISFTDHSKEFSKFRDDLLRFTIRQILYFSAEDFKDKNFGNARERLSLLFDNKELWTGEDVYHLILDYLVDLLKIDLDHGAEIFNLFKDELGEEFTGTFGTLDKTIEYLKSKDNELLEKLFPEEREVVEELVKQIEEKNTTTEKIRANPSLSPFG